MITCAKTLVHPYKHITGLGWQAEAEAGKGQAEPPDVASIGRAFKQHRSYFCKVLRARTREVCL